MKQLEKENQIREYFDFYQREVLPEVEKWGFQQEDGYHGLYTHTKAVVFRAIDYALELGKNPVPVIFAAACHDMARIGNGPEKKHGPDALPLAEKVMEKFPKLLNETERQAVSRAIEFHTEGQKAPDYISACLWDADRTRLAWDFGYHAEYFNTDYAKRIASHGAEQYTDWQNKVLWEKNNSCEKIQKKSLCPQKEFY